MPALERYASSTMTRTASGSSDDVVVAEEQEGRAFDGRQRIVGGGREADVLVEAAHERGRHRRRDAGRRVLGRAVVEHEHRQRRVVLGGQAGDRILEPGARIAA